MIHSMNFHFNNTQTQDAVIDVQNEPHIHIMSNVFRWARFCNEPMINVSTTLEEVITGVQTLLVTYM